MDHVYTATAHRLKQIYLDRVEHELRQFSSALNDWIYALAENPRRDWRQRLDGFFAEQEAWGRFVEPENRRELIEYLEDWSSSIAWDRADSKRPPAQPRTVWAAGTGQMKITQVSLVPEERNSLPPLPPNEDQEQFDRKLESAQRRLDEIEGILTAFAEKLAAAGDAAVVVESEIEQIEGLIYEHNEHMEAARAAWLRGNLGGNTFGRLTKASSPASHDLPLFVDKRQAQRARDQWQRIGHRLKQRIKTLDGVITTMEWIERAGTVAGAAAGFAIGGGAILVAVKAGGKLAVARTTLKIAAATGAAHVVGVVVDAALTAAGVEEETVSKIKNAAELVSWLLLLRKIRPISKLPNAPERPKPVPEKVAPAPQPQKPRVPNQPRTNRSGNPDDAAAAARTQPHGPPPSPVHSENLSITHKSIPSVSNAKLSNIVNDLYKGAKGPKPIGTGSTADAVRNELITGLPTHGRFHTQKAEEYSNALRNWLKNNPNASARDRLVAQSLLDDLQTALGGN